MEPQAVDPDYTVYTSETLDARVIQQQLDQPGASSKLCLSCHDGTLAIGNVNVLNGAGSPTSQGSVAISMQGVDASGTMPAGPFGPALRLHSSVGPTETVSLNFGNDDTQIGIKYGDTEDQFTTLFTADRIGNILIADKYNRKVLIFSSTGQYVATIVPKISLGREKWPNKLFAISNSRMVIASGYDYQIYDYQGSLINKINIGNNTVLIAALWDGTLIIKGNIFYKYNAAGQLIQSDKTSPLDIGRLHQGDPVNSSYRFIIEYPELTYGFTIPTAAIGSYYRDAQNKLGVSYETARRDLVYKISSCGNILGQVQLPTDEIAGEIIVGGEKFANYSARYGNATFGADGNVYTWKKTNTTYSILKWTWVDDPNVPTGPDAPTNLTAKPSINGLYLAWTASSSDPGCVTGYEIAQATTSGGAYTTIATVNAGVLKYSDMSAIAGPMYYYKIRAKAGTYYSLYTSEVSGKR